MVYRFEPEANDNELKEKPNVTRSAPSIRPGSHNLANNQLRDVPQQPAEINPQNKNSSVAYEALLVVLGCRKLQEQR